MILTGLCRLGRDAVMRQLQDGTDVANLALAYNHGKKDADGKRPTQWVDASLWGDRAAKLAPYLLKGTQISVVLHDVHGEQWKKQDGTSGYSLRGRVVQSRNRSRSQRQSQRRREVVSPTWTTTFRFEAQVS